MNLKILNLRFFLGKRPYFCIASPFLRKLTYFQALKFCLPGAAANRLLAKARDCFAQILNLTFAGFWRFFSPSDSGKVRVLTGGKAHDSERSFDRLGEIPRPTVKSGIKSRRSLAAPFCGGGFLRLLRVFLNLKGALCAAFILTIPKYAF